MPQAHQVAGDDLVAVTGRLLDVDVANLLLAVLVPAAAAGLDGRAELLCQLDRLVVDALVDVEVARLQQQHVVEQVEQAGVAREGEVA